MKPLLESISPNKSRVAVVEQDERVAYFRIKGVGPSLNPIRSCWIRNLVIPPEDVDIESIRLGRPPLLPRCYCRIEDASPPIDVDEAEIIWLEEGDAAVLIEGEEVVAYLPAWSGRDGFHGYALECAYPNPQCWPLESENPLFGRLAASKLFWKSWEDGETPWEMLRDRLIDLLERRLGPHSAYYAIDNGSWPARGLVHVPVNGGLVVATIGMSLRPQPATELYVEYPMSVRRVELAMCLSNQCSPELTQAFSRWLVVMANAPWQSMAWFGDGHVVTCSGLLPQLDLHATAMTSSVSGAPDLNYGSFLGDPINLLWVVPLTRKEDVQGAKRGGPSLSEKLKQQGVTWMFKPSRL